jgi:two-component system, NarL family, nitrate/nitrite response regulator NarL
MQRPRVYVVSDVRLYREGLTRCLAAQGDLSVIGSGPATDAVEQIARVRPDVMLLDLGTEHNLGLPRSACAVSPALRIVAFAVAEVAADVLACAEAGICGYVAKDASVEDVVAAVLHAVSGELFCSPRIAAMLFERVAALSVKRSMPPALESLTPRELEVIGLVARGLPNKAIARELQLEPATIKNHVHHILQKLNLQRRGEIGLLRLAAPRPSALSGEPARPANPSL